MISAWVIYANGELPVLLNDSAVAHHAARIFRTNRGFVFFMTKGKLRVATLCRGTLRNTRPSEAFGD